MREIASVTTAVAHGDLTKKIERPAKGEILQLQQTINTMVGQLRTFASEVTRVARDVGTEGMLGGQADVMGVQGMWNELTVNVNAMANNLTTQVRDIAKVTTAVAKGDLTQKVQAECKGEIFELKSTINSMVEQLQQFAREVSKIAREVGTEGRLGGQATVNDVQGTWRDLTDNVNGMAMNLTTQVREIIRVTAAVARGDLTKKIGVEVNGEILELKLTINSMVDRLGTFAFEVSKVAREVGTDGTLGGQARVDGVEGKWRDLTENVNTMALNLTSQVRGISTVTQAIADGNMSQKIDVQAKGEILVLKETINNMVDRLSVFCNEVQRVARDVGVDGKMGGQADVGGLKGRWKEITADVNTMATNLVSDLSSELCFVGGISLISYRPHKYALLAISRTRLPTAISPNLLTWKLPARWTSSNEKSTRWSTICATASRETPKPEKPRNKRTRRNPSFWLTCPTRSAHL